MSTRPEVVVAGGGAVGLAAAVAFAADGRRVRLLMPEPAPQTPEESYDLRVYALSPANIDWLQELGVWPRVLRHCPYRRMSVWADSLSDALDFDCGDAVAPALGDIIEHGVLMHALWQQLLASGVEVQTSAVEEVSDDADGLRVFCADGDVLAPQLLVAADGSSSMLRDAAGIDVDAWDYGQRAIVGNLRFEHSLEATAWQRFLPSGPLALLPLAEDVASIVWSAEEAMAAPLMAADDKAFCAALETALQGRFGACSLLGARADFPLRHQHAQRYAVGRIALVGDAAHVIHPLAGQGLNLGFGDVQALVSEQTGVGLGAPRALARYSRRRRTVAADLVAVTDGLHRLFTQTGDELAELRNLGLNLVNRAAPLRRLLVERAMGTRL
jgi:2-octaprenyl-3-methyl-6-methoxy-1,4-benzoquinol hydroxylase